MRPISSIGKCWRHLWIGLQIDLRLLRHRDTATRRSYRKIQRFELETRRHSESECPTPEKTLLEYVERKCGRSAYWSQAPLDYRESSAVFRVFWFCGKMRLATFAIPFSNADQTSSVFGRTSAVRYCGELCRQWATWYGREIGCSKLVFLKYRSFRDFSLWHWATLEFMSNTQLSVTRVEKNTMSVSGISSGGYVEPGSRKFQLRRPFLCLSALFEFLSVMRM